MTRLLILEDDPDLNRLMADYFRAAGYEVASAQTGEEALAHGQVQRPDLAILDVMVPGIDGWTVLERLREGGPLPALFVTARGAQEDVQRGLMLGADDYVRKPFDLRELELRVAAVLRRSQPTAEPEPEVYDDGRLRIDLGRRAASVAGQPVRLTPTEFRLLAYLLRHAGRPVPHAELLAEVWGPAYVDDVANLQVYVRYLREKLEADPKYPRYIVTAWGSGYQFTP